VYYPKSGKTKKDLDNLLKIVLDVLSVNMVNTQNPMKGIGLMLDDSDVQKIVCEKKIVDSPDKEGIDLQISSGRYP